MKHRPNIYRNTSTDHSVNLKEALDSVSAKVSRAFRISNQVLNDLHIPHVLIGGLAVGSYGFHYATKDVDYLVGEEIADKTVSKLITAFIAGVPNTVGDVGIDYLDSETARNYPKIKIILDNIVDEARSNPDKITIVSLPVLVFLKLLANRPKDHTGLTGLLNAGCIDVEEIREFLTENNATDRLAIFNRLVRKSERDV